MSPTRSVSLIWAQATSGVIGRDGGIPWRLAEDQARFKQLTLGHTVVMGRLTWESLPRSVRPLPRRRNIVLTRRTGYQAPGAEVVADLSAIPQDGQTWVIGGTQIYALVLPLANRCEVTEVDIDLPRRDGDALAPELDHSWTVSAGRWLTSAAGLRYRFLSLHR